MLETISFYRDALLYGEIILLVILPICIAIIFTKQVKISQFIAFFIFCLLGRIFAAMFLPVGGNSANMVLEAGMTLFAGMTIVATMIWKNIANE